MYKSAQLAGDFSKIAILLSTHQANPNQLDENNCTALHWAAINNQLSTVKLLVDAGALVDYAGGDLMATPLHWAARAGHVQMVTYLYMKGADPYLRDTQGYNALHLAGIF